MSIGAILSFLKSEKLHLGINIFDLLFSFWKTDHSHIFYTMFIRFFIDSYPFSRMKIELGKISLQQEYQWSGFCPNVAA
jgi:hypothetical protein